MRVKYDSELLKLMVLFESMSGAKIKDCIASDKLFFIVKENEMGKAIGKNGVNIKKFENKTKKKVKLAEFSNDIAQFARNLAYPAEILDVKNENGVITIQGRDANSRAMLIGRDRQNLNHMKEIIRRYFDVKEIKIV